MVRETVPITCNVPTRLSGLSVRALAAFVVLQLACAAQRQTTPPQWTQIPLHYEGTLAIFLGQGVGSTEPDAIDAAFRAARREISRVRRVHLTSELSDVARNLTLTVGNTASILSREEIVHETREASSSVISFSEPYGATRVECNEQRCIAYARVAIDEERVYPARRLTRVLQSNVNEDVRAARLLQLAETFEVEGEPGLSELALEIAAQDLQSVLGRAAGLRLAWFLFRQGREVEAIQWLVGVGDFGTLDSLPRASAESLSRLLEGGTRSFSDYVNELSRLVTRYSSAQRLSLRPLFTQPLPVVADSLVSLDFLVESRGSRRAVALLWIDENGVVVRPIDATTNTIEGVHLLTLEGKRESGNILLFAVGAEDLTDLLKLQEPEKAFLVDRTLADAGNRLELATFRGLIRMIGRIMRQTPNAAMALVIFTLE